MRQAGRKDSHIRARRLLLYAPIAALVLLAPAPASAATTTTTFTAAADAYVSQAQPNRKFGGVTELRAQAPPSEFRSYLRFDVQGVAGTVSRATLRLRPTGAATAFSARAVAPGSWNESNITWRNAPALGSAAGSSTLGADGWTTTDVTALVSGNGSVSVGLTTASATLVTLASREVALSAPQLVVESVVAPAVTLTAPAPGTATNDSTPTFSGAAGTATGDSSTVTVKLYVGSSASGTPATTLSATRSGSSWSVTPGTPLADGTWTAQAEQSNTDGTVGRSAPSTFSVDTAAPAVTLTTPSTGTTTSDTTPDLAGAAGAAPGDAAVVQVEIRAGPDLSGSLVQSLTATRVGGTWSTSASPALANGTYTAVARQGDSAGNTGVSTSSTFTVSATAPPPSTYRSEVMADSPRAYWRLGENGGATAAADETANSNTGSYVNGPVLGAAGALAGDTNTAAVFDGVNDYMTVPDSASLDVNSAVTVEAWLKRTKASWQVVVGKPGNGQSKFENYALWINSSNQAVAYFGNGSSYATVASTGPIDTAWHHVVATYAAGSAKLYLDGVLNASSTSSVQLTPNTLALNVGRESANNYFFGGSLDEVAVYGTALSAARIQQHYAAGTGIEIQPPAPTLTTPPAGSLTADTTPAFAGMTAMTGTDSSTVTVRVYAGTSAGGTPVQTLTTTRFPSGGWNVSPSSALPLGTYTAQAEQTDAGNLVRSPARTFTVTTRQPAGTDPELVGAGDIAYCDDTGDDRTAVLLDGFPSATVFTLGDNAYESGTPAEFANCYQPTWGRAKARTRPALGDHDYADGADRNATGYVGYFGTQLAPFGAAASDPLRGWYSYNAGTWHVVVLNSSCGGSAIPACSASAQLSWLQADLAANPVSCTLAVLHAPRWSSGSIHGSNASMQGYWDVLYQGGVELVMGGDDHDYERFAPQDGQGRYKAAGLRQMVVGTGGRSHYTFGNANSIVAGSEVRNDATFGILRLVLRPGSYEWEFVPEAGGSFMDAGSDVCH